MVSFFSPKGWEFSAQGKERSDAALGNRRVRASSPKGWDKRALSQPFGRLGLPRGFPRALPWAENSQPFGLKNETNCGTLTCVSVPLW